ncbi:MAG TPA: sarcosine oxidase subunit gamma family protein [Gammaproteobacteria bacterium]|nr:sarcosine oxidase subunit gamma family protein [Gammaproteobacteria bacterium]
MAEVVERTALSEHPKSRLRTAGTGGLPGAVLEEQRPAAIAQINGAPQDSRLAAALDFLALESTPESRRACTGKGGTLLWNGPGQWLAVSRSTAAEEFLPQLRRALEPHGATVTDLSHARTVVRIAGPKARDVMLKGCPLELESFNVNDCAASLLGHLNVQIHCLGDHTFDLYVFRSFGVAMWEWLIDAALEYGVEMLPGE